MVYAGCDQAPLLRELVKRTISRRVVAVNPTVTRRLG